MERFTLELPAMYGDHHVIEVRNILSALPGIAEIYASAAWRQVELEFDADQTDPGAIKAALEARGYSTEVTLPPVAARTAGLTDFAPGQSAAVRQFAEHLPPVEPFGPCPGFEVRHPGDVHPADQ